MSGEWLVIAGAIWLLVHLQHRISDYNAHTPYNGHGCVEDVLRKQALAPMAYRVLVPLVLKWTGARGRLLFWYFVSRDLLLIGAMVAIGCLIGWVLVPFLVVVLLVISILQYDYWDCWIEVLAFVAVLSGNHVCAVLACMALAASRETWPVAIVCYAAASGSALLAVLAWIPSMAVMGAVIAWQGVRPIYCDRLAIKENVGRILSWREYRYWYWEPMGVVWMVMCCACFLLRGTMPEPFASTAFIPPGLAAMTFIFGRIVEPRLMIAGSIWIAAWIL